MARFPGLDELFEGRHFDSEIIVLCVRWYFCASNSASEILVEMMTERGLLDGAHDNHALGYHHYVPEFELPLEPVRNGRSALRGVSTKPM